MCRGSTWSAFQPAFLPLLRRSAAPVVVDVSSSLAFLTRVATPGTRAHAYPGFACPAAKTAVNVLTVQYAKAFPTMRINAVEPGSTRSDLNGNSGLQSAEHDAEITVRMAQVGAGRPHRWLLRRRRRPALVTAGRPLFGGRRVASSPTADRLTATRRTRCPIALSLPVNGARALAR